LCSAATWLNGAVNELEDGSLLPQYSRIRTRPTVRSASSAPPFAKWTSEHEPTRALPELIHYVGDGVATLEPDLGLVRGHRLTA
jgi:hypothetical protein